MFIMGNKSRHAQLAKSLAGMVGYDPEKDRSPFGAKPVPPIRYGEAPNVPRISNVADLIAEDYIVPTVQGVKYIGNTIKEHPAETAAGVAAGLTLPVSAMGLLGAGALGVAGRAIDKTHPLTNERMDYGRESGGQTAKDLALSGGVNALFHGLLGPTASAIDPSALEAGVLRRGPLREFALPENPRYIPSENIV